MEPKFYTGLVNLKFLKYFEINLSHSILTEKEFINFLKTVKKL